MKTTLFCATSLLALLAVSHAENTFGRPEAQISNGVARPTVRGAWSGQPGKKRAALVFIAPSAGKYTLEGSALIDFYNGDKAKGINRL